MVPPKTLSDTPYTRASSLLLQAEDAANPSGGQATGAKVKEVVAAFTANVWEVKCQRGDVVEKGDTLLVLEAMKMEYPVAAEFGGKVLEVHVESNALTQQGDVLVSLAAAESATHPEE